MIVAVAIMGMVQMAADEVIDMITMRNRGMAAVAAVNVRDGMRTAIMIGGAAIRIDGIDRDYMLVNMIGMGMMQMTIMQIIRVIAVANGQVAAVGAVLMLMVGVMIQVVSCHGADSFDIWRGDAVVSAAWLKAFLASKRT